MKLVHLFFRLLIFTVPFLVSCDKGDDNAQAVSSFTFTNGGCIGPCTVTFTNTSKNATSYSWDFGDGSPESTEANPVHEFAAAGTYEVTLTATGPAGTTRSIQSVVIVQAAYYITFKANGVPVAFKVLTGTRNIAANPRTLTVAGTGTAGANPKFKFFVEESFIGFVPGLHVGCYATTYPFSYIEYTDASGTVYSTQNDAEGVDVFFTALSYTNGGTVSGTFTGVLRASSGAIVDVADGDFRVKLGN
jgi:PKD repeat protein